MKAIVHTAYGPPEVLQLREIEKPAPKDAEVRIRVRATAVNFGDLLVRDFKRISPSQFSMPAPLWLPARLQFGFNHPRQPVLGNEFAGDIEAVGQAVKRFQVGDAVFGYRGSSMGANAEFLCMAEAGLIAHKPANMTYAEAATVPYGALTALSLLRTAKVQSGQKVLINGASGGIGAQAVQLARHFGAEVTGVCSTRRLAFVKALGADHVIDYTHEDFTRNGETYDLIVDILGKSTFARCRGSLTPNGRYLLASFKTRHLLQMLATSITGGQKVICALSSESLADLLFIKTLMEAGKLIAAIDRCFPLEQTAEAHRYIEQAHNQGQVVITIAHAQ